MQYQPRVWRNETMVREARILSVLDGSDVPHPALYAVCADELSPLPLTQQNANY